MNLVQILDKYFTILTQEAGFPENKVKEMRIKFLKLWLERVGIKVLPHLLNEEKQIMNELSQLKENETEKATILFKKLEEGLSKDTARTEKVMEVFFKEAESLLKRMTKVFLKNSSLEKIASVREKYKALG